MKLYKLTDSAGYTRREKYNECQWGEGVSHSADSREKATLCGPGVIHAYTSPLLAILLNPIHANLDKSLLLLWEAEGDVVARDWDKVGVLTLTTLKQISAPVITTEVRVTFGILCAQEVCEDAAWNKWSADWLSGKDRSSESARTARASAREAERAARASACAVECLEEAATRAAEWAAWAVEWAARAAERAARAAEWAAWAVERAVDTAIDFHGLAEKAIALAKETHKGSH